MAIVAQSAPAMISGIAFIAAGTTLFLFMRLPWLTGLRRSLLREARRNRGYLMENDATVVDGHQSPIFTQQLLSGAPQRNKAMSAVPERRFFGSTWPFSSNAGEVDRPAENALSSAEVPVHLRGLGQSRLPISRNATILGIDRHLRLRSLQSASGSFPTNPNNPCPRSLTREVIDPGGDPPHHGGNNDAAVCGPARDALPAVGVVCGSARTASAPGPSCGMVGPDWKDRSQSQ
jgi:hypothetical protein